MKIDQLDLCNYKGFTKIRFEFHEKLNLFVGINGSGKSSVLDAMATALSWLVNRIQRERANGSQISESELRNGAEKGYIDILATHKTSNYRWCLTKSARGSKSDLASYDGVSTVAEVIRGYYHDTSTLPVIAYYPVSRAVNRIAPDIPSRDSVSDLDVYENALSGKSNFHSLFEWFRHQDDILNEKARSRSHWLKQHNPWIRQRVNKILSTLEGLSSEDDERSREEFKYLSKMFKDEFIIEEPRMLFMELSHLTHRFGIKAFRKSEIMHAIDDIEFMFHKMSSLSKEFRDDLIEDHEHFFHLINRIMKSFKMPLSDHQNEENAKQAIQFLWQSFSFAVLLSLWWMSDKGRRKVERLLKKILSSIQQDQYSGLEYDFTKQLRHIVKDDIASKKQIERNEGKELHFVRQAIEAFIPDYKNLQVKRVPRPRMELTKNDETFDLNQLSDGEKNLIALIGDIARRLTMANPDINNPLEVEGIILIDEIDLHLHPKWQRIVAQKMPDIFPNCQFFISTHSPQVISHIKPESIFVLQNIDNEIQIMRPSETYGMSIDRVVELVMDDYARAEKPRKDLDMLFELIERKNFGEAKKLLSKLKKDMCTDPDIIRAEALIRIGERQA